MDTSSHERGLTLRRSSVAWAQCLAIVAAVLCSPGAMVARADQSEGLFREEAV
ncbi:MAG: hypothetical protein HN742_20890 [Lentisphaerae bacterium]|jgi:hypothetical protein|nr:hypothetical protein [Lentisphaerota bacterium]MBT4823210.1 hypothetical protein [Lentisphaerota bacterium]MBT5610720.1 hypothetical protein [Lentisphaerota bacterium]MBT7054289.1 hypothetical protein [Lentisphaerota bacterium]MBT7844350.1 hypothetical protein [Lentisphaerota bacterium]